MLKLLVGAFTKELSNKTNWFMVNSSFCFLMVCVFTKYTEEGVGKGFIRLVCTVPKPNQNKTSFAREVW